LQGAGTLVETMLSWPLDKRPVLAVLQEGRPDMDPGKFLKTGLLKPLAFLDHPATSTRMVIYAWDWLNTGGACLPGPAILRQLPLGAQLRDELNVALPSSEKSHSYSASGSGAQAPLTVLARMSLGPKGPGILDPGRRVFGGESFILGPYPHGRVWLAARVKAGQASLLNIECRAGGNVAPALFKVHLKGGNPGFDEVLVELPSALVNGSWLQFKVYLGPTEGETPAGLSGHKVYGSYHYWLYQE
jgi:hypothetical protein